MCSECGGSSADPVDPEVIQFLLRIDNESLPRLASQPPGRSVLEKVDELCARVRRRFLQHELKSYDVIRETLEALTGSERSHP